MSEGLILHLLGQIVVIEEVSDDFQTDITLFILLQVLAGVELNQIAGFFVLFEVQNMRCSEYCLFVDDGSCSELLFISSFKRVKIFAYDFADAVVWMFRRIDDFLSVIIL